MCKYSRLEEPDPPTDDTWSARRDHKIAAFLKREGHSFINENKREVRMAAWRKGAAVRIAIAAPKSLHTLELTEIEATQLQLWLAAVLKSDALPVTREDGNG